MVTTHPFDRWDMRKVGLDNKALVVPGAPSCIFLTSEHVVVVQLKDSTVAQFSPA